MPLPSCSTLSFFFSSFRFVVFAKFLREERKRERECGGEIVVGGRNGVDAEERRE